MTATLIKILALLTSIYSYNVETLNGNTVQLNQYIGKKILLVNIASNGEDSAQINQLEQLHQQHNDSLLIIAFPTNSFGNETRDSAALATWLYQDLGVHFVVAKPVSVTGANKHPLYDWLADMDKNGQASFIIRKDFQKYLISKSGQLMGFFDSKALPTGTIMQSAIQSPF